MNTTNLKIIACLAMLADHMGAVFFPECLYLTIIGRIAFPIFAFLIAEGYFYTHNVKKYLIRLFAFALISEIPYNYAFHGEMIASPGLNVFFTLFLGLLAIYLYDHFKKQNIVLGVVPVVIIGVIAYFINTDYGMIGVFMIFAFYIFRNDFYKKALSYIVLTGAILVMYSAYEGISVQLYSILALILIYFYNGKKGFNIKYLFYIFYPGHLLILGLLRYVF